MKCHRQQLTTKVTCLISYFGLNSKCILIFLTIIFGDFQCEMCHYARLLDVTFCAISAADAVVSEPEEVRETTEEKTVSVVSSTTEQASEMSTEVSSKEGKCLETFLLKRTTRFYFADY